MFYLMTHSTHFIYGYMEREREMFYLTTHSTHFIYGYMERERNVLFNDALNTFYLWLYGEREMFYLTTHSTHFIYGYMTSDIWLRTILIVREETRCHHIGYSYRLTARVLLYAPSHRQDSTYHGLCYTSRGALAGTRLQERYKTIIHMNKEQVFYLTTHSTHFVYGYMASGIWVKQVQQFEAVNSMTSGSEVKAKGH